MSRIVAVCNQKGGVAKTTTTANLGAGLAREGQRVLMIDLDPQAALTFTFVPEEVSRTFKKSVLDFLVRGTFGLYPCMGKPPEALNKKAYLEFIHANRESWLELLPATLDLSAAEMNLLAEPGREFLLKRAMRKHSGTFFSAYDWIFIDCPPSLGLLSLNALAAADSILIPVAAEGLPLKGLADLLRTIEVVRERLNPNLEIEGILLTRARRTNIARDVYEALVKDFGEKVYRSKISEAVVAMEAPMSHKSVWDHAPGSPSVAEYMALVEEVVDRAKVRETIKEVSR